MKWLAISMLIWGTAVCTEAYAQVKSRQKISTTAGGFTGALYDHDQFGVATAPLGDFDGDGIPDLAVGTVFRQAVWILFLNQDGSVKAHQRTPAPSTAMANIGDFDGDGITDLAVGDPSDDDGGTNRGAVWLLMLNPDGTVKDRHKISDTEGGFTGVLDDEDWFGFSVTGLGDFDGDGITDLAVGAPTDDDGGTNYGALWLLMLNPDGTVKGHQKISQTQGGFTGTGLFEFGFSVVTPGDFDDDGITDLATIPYSPGVVWLLLLNPDGTVKQHQKIDASTGGPAGTGRGFSWITNMGDLTGDGIADLAVGAPWVDAVFLLFLNSDGTALHYQTIRGPTDTFFGRSVANLGDIDGDTIVDMAVGAIGDDDGGLGRGAAWTFFLDYQVVAIADRGITDEGGSVAINLLANDRVTAGGTLSVDSLSAPAYGTVEVLADQRVVRYTHDGSETLLDQFTYTARENNGSSARATVYVDITPVNDAPHFTVTPVITTPGDGTRVNIGGDEEGDPLPPETPFLIAWNEAVDPEGDALSYRWQLATAPAFSESTLLLDADAGAQTQVEMSLGEVAGLLTNQGIDLFGEVTLFHRVEATDGLLTETSDAASLTLVRGTLVHTEETVPLPEAFALHQNYPNPFTSTTRLRYALPERAPVRMAVYDGLGRLIEVLVAAEQPAGWHEVPFDASHLPSGVYFYTLQAGSFTKTCPMTLVR